MQAILERAAAAQSATGLSGRRLCRRVGLSRATFCRWRWRQCDGHPLLRPPGPAKTGPLPLAQVRAQIAQLHHGAKRTQGTSALYQQYADCLSRRDLADLVAAERCRQRQAQQAQLRQITWLNTQTAWALDSTEWPTTQPGVKLQVLVAADLASQYNLGLAVHVHLSGDLVAAYLAQLIRHHGPPLFLKRDNGAVLHTPAVEQVLAQAAILPLDSPLYYPAYNGALERQIGGFKQGLPYPLPCPAGDLQPARATLAGLRLELNARPRASRDDCSPAEFFHTGPRHRVNRRTRHAIFASLYAQTWLIFPHMKPANPRTFAAAWRYAAEDWLRCQSLITITHPKPNHEPITSTNHNRYPFSPLNGLIISKP